MTAAVLLVVAVLLIAFGGLMTAIEAALGVTSRQDLHDMAASGRNASALAAIADDPDTHVDAVVFIRVLAETAAAVLVTAALMLLLDDIGWALAAAIVLMTGISFVAVGASPRAVGRRNARALLRGSARLTRGIRVLLGPVAHLLEALGNRVTPGVSRAASFDSEEQLLSMVDEAAMHDLIEEDDRELIHSVFDFTDTYVRAVMVPRTDMVTVSADASTKDALSLFLDRGVSRMPVIGEDGDDVQGILYLKDLVQLAFRDGADGWSLPLARITRPAVFVPESMRAETLLQQMKRDAVHVCMVVDEYGGVAGLVTLEDIIEEIVGEISDEYDARVDETVEVAPGRFRVSARLSLAEVGDLFGIELDDEDVDSVGGLLGKGLGRVPQPGASVEESGLVLTGGTSRGRGRGLATVFVERSPGLAAAEEAFASRSPRTGELAVAGGGSTREQGRKGDRARKADRPAKERQSKKDRR